jgi:hypothetical protein
VLSSSSVRELGISLVLNPFHSTCTEAVLKQKLSQEFESLQFETPSVYPFAPFVASLCHKHCYYLVLLVYFMKCIVGEH